MRYYVDKVMKGWVQLFDRPMDMLDAARKANPDGGGPERGSERWFSEQHWIGSNIALKGWKDVEKYLKTPWEYGIKEVKKLVEKITPVLPEPRSIKRKFRWSDQDGEVDVSRAVADDPYFMRETHRDFRPHAVSISLLCQFADSASVAGGDIFWRGAAAIATMDLLERAGYTCEVWTWQVSRNIYAPPYRSALQACRIKKAGDPIDMALIVAVLSGWFFRTAGLSAEDWPTRCYGENHGQVVRHLSDEWKHHIDIDAMTVCIHCPIIHHESQMVPAANEILNQVYTAVGGVKI
jgi:hypothetical protein